MTELNFAGESSGRAANAPPAPQNSHNNGVEIIARETNIDQPSSPTTTPHNVKTPAEQWRRFSTQVQQYFLRPPSNSSSTNLHQSPNRSNNNTNENSSSASICSSSVSLSSSSSLVLEKTNPGEHGASKFPSDAAIGRKA